MKKLSCITSILLLAFLLSACSKEKPIKYDLTLISPDLESVYNYFVPTKSEENHYELASSADYGTYVTDVELKNILSVTICDKDVSPQSAQAIIDLCKKTNIPVFFMFDEIEKDTLLLYDKAYCISADYTYIGEKFATAINTMWEEGQIKDRDKNLIFAFSVIIPETFTDSQQKFYDSLIKNIELLGVPIEKLDEAVLSEENFLQYLKENRKASESFILIDSSFLSLAKEEYEPYGEGVEMLGIDYGTENTYIDTPYIKICFIDYLEYFKTKDLIFSNIKEKIYPFENLTHNVIDKSIFIEPVI